MSTIRAVAISIAIAVTACVEQPAQIDRTDNIIQPLVCGFAPCASSAQCDFLGECRFCNVGHCSNVLVADPPDVPADATTSQLDE